MNLTALVPPFELCKQIPEGAFEDAALVWCDRKWDVDVYPRECKCYRPLYSKNVVPAPTIEEIKADFYARGGGWLKSCVYYDGKTYDRPGCVHSAMELWLKLFCRRRHCRQKDDRHRGLPRSGADVV